MKVEVAAMHLDSDALDLYAWINGEDEILLWDDLVRTFQENYGPPEFQNPDEFLCSIKQIGMVAEYRREYARRVARFEAKVGQARNSTFQDPPPRHNSTQYHSSQSPVSYNLSWPDIISAPTTSSTTLPTIPKSNNPSSSKPGENEWQHRRDKGLCYCCGAPFSPGHWCKSALSIMEYRDSTNYVSLEAAEAEAQLYEQEVANDGGAAIPYQPP
ncbi:hypothetical protein LIER_09932 [Lithospermum erythrorhizon]|uniref:Retrotransposon gag domain-containing protein n=1 Tax=Lithospermum erythrorhizon TaxID=34254 RepID=A0AAV3PHM1_LITER